MTTTLYVVPCGAAKLDREAPARELYTSDHFRRQLRAAEEAAKFDGGRVLILSALYGLVDPDEMLDPYDLKMGQPGSINVCALALQLKAIDAEEVYAFLPRAYYEVLRVAGQLADTGVVWDVYEGTRGCGDHRFVCTSITREEAAA